RRSTITWPQSPRRTGVEFCNCISRSTRSNRKHRRSSRLRLHVSRFWFLVLISLTRPRTGQGMTSNEKRETRDEKRETASSQQLLHKFLLIEVLKIGQLLTGTNKAGRERELILDGYDDAPFPRSIQFGHNYPG